LLGESVVALHAASVSGSRRLDTAGFWRKLHRDACELSTLRWWKQGARAIRRHVLEVRTDERAAAAAAGAFAAAAAASGRSLLGPHEPIHEL
jgi:hypothetical protein